MSDRSLIEWTDATWNPVRGCTKVSPGCKFCYAEVFSKRFRGVPGHPFEQGFDLRLVPENFLFIERDPANLAAFEAELSQLTPLPAPVNVEMSEGDAFERLSAILNELRRDRAQMAPATCGRLRLEMKVWWTRFSPVGTH